MQSGTLITVLTILRASIALFNQFGVLIVLFGKIGLICVLFTRRAVFPWNSCPKNEPVRKNYGVKKYFSMCGKIFAPNCTG